MYRQELRERLRIPPLVDYVQEKRARRRFEQLEEHWAAREIALATPPEAVQDSEVVAVVKEPIKEDVPKMSPCAKSDQPEPEPELESVDVSVVKEIINEDVPEKSDQPEPDNVKETMKENVPEMFPYCAKSDQKPFTEDVVGTRKKGIMERIATLLTCGNKANRACVEKNLKKKKKVSFIARICSRIRAFSKRRKEN